MCPFHSEEPALMGVRLRDPAEPSVQPAVPALGKPERGGLPVRPERGCGPVMGIPQEQREHDVRETQPSHEVSVYSPVRLLLCCLSVSFCI